jgi:tRNA (guanine-N7-)-methyltransferase
MLGKKVPQESFLAALHNLTTDCRCGNGELMRNLAEQDPSSNYVGIDIRDSYIRDAMDQQPALPNLHFVQANLTYNVQPVLGTLPDKIRSMSVMYPDPWFKPKHHKRRLMNLEFLAAVAPFARQGAPLHFQTDSFDLFTEAEELLMNNPFFVRQIPNPEVSPFLTTTYFQRRTVQLESRNQFMLLALRT